MTLSNTGIHQIELLLTLDYLLNHTNENHPATQIDICEHARKYGLKFDKSAKQGNQVRRQRIGECLKFLKQVSDDFVDDVPFVLETTDSGKYYIEQRHGLNENQVAKILAAISNDKYTKDEDTDFLIKRVLGAFSTNDENRKIIDAEYKRLLRGGKKYDKETIRKINVIEKAYLEGKMVKIRFSVFEGKGNSCIDYYFWYRVYLIKAYHDKLYALLIPIGQIDVNETYGRLMFYNDYIFEAIENIDIPNEPERKILCDDFDDNRDFNELFREKCPKLAKEYGTLDEMVRRKILPNDGNTSIVSFYFNLGVKDYLKRSFENFFSENFRYQERDTIKGIESEIKDLSVSIDNWTIVTDEPKKSKHPEYGLVNISVDSKSFMSWILSDLHGDGSFCVADAITIIKPSSINENLANYYCNHLINKLKYLKESPKRTMFQLIKSDLADESKENLG